MNQTIVLATPHRRYDRLEVALRDRVDTVSFTRSRRSQGRVVADVKITVEREPSK